jgi:hypothetical protein
MKKFTFLIGMMLVTSIVFGQVNLKSYRQSTVPGTQISTDKVLTGTLDTLWQYYTRATGFFVYNAGSYGYVAPSNSFSTETGMQYSFSGSAKVEQLLMCSDINSKWAPHLALLLQRFIILLHLTAYQQELF